VSKFETNARIILTNPHHWQELKEGSDLPLNCHFGDDATRKTVRAMIAVMEQSLLVNKNPELRARKIISRFVRQPDMKKVLDVWVQDSFKWDKKQMMVLLQVSWLFLVDVVCVVSRSYVRCFISVSFRWLRTSGLPLGCTKTSATRILWT
jgi:hypothetical protein